MRLSTLISSTNSLSHIRTLASGITADTASTGQPTKIDLKYLLCKID